VPLLLAQATAARLQHPQLTPHGCPPQPATPCLPPAGPAHPLGSAPSAFDACADFVQLQQHGDQPPILDAAASREFDRAVAAVAAADPAQLWPLITTTQANCSCAFTWWQPPDAWWPQAAGVASVANVTYVGCAAAPLGGRPPLAAWCPVDPSTCHGSYYGVWAPRQGEFLFRTPAALLLEAAATGGGGGSGLTSNASSAAAVAAAAEAMAAFAFDYCKPVRTMTRAGCLCAGVWWAEELGSGEGGGIGSRSSGGRRYFGEGGCVDPAAEPEVNHGGWVRSPGLDLPPACRCLCKVAELLSALLFS